MKKTPQEITDEYIISLAGADLPQENIDQVKAAMKKYGDNRWWESQDPEVIARYQFFEGIIMSDFGTFHRGLEILVGRPVYVHELALNREGLTREVQEAIDRKDRKTGPLEENVAYEREFEGFKTLIDYAGKTGMKLEVVGPNRVLH